MTESTADISAAWYATQPDTVRGVIETAELRELVTFDVHDRILNAWGSAYADVVRKMAENLNWIEQLTYGNPVDVLHAFDGPGSPRHLHPVDDADALRARLQADVVSNAQWIASLLKLRGAA